jgi:protein PhnA
VWNLPDPAYFDMVQSAFFITIFQGADMATRDSNGNELNDGDSVQVIKDLKLKGSSSVLKRGKTFKNIRLTNKEEEIEVREGKTTLVLRAEFLKKV